MRPDVVSAPAYVNRWGKFGVPPDSGMGRKQTALVTTSAKRQAMRQHARPESSDGVQGRLVLCAVSPASCTQRRDGRVCLSLASRRLAVNNVAGQGVRAQTTCEPQCICVQAGQLRLAVSPRCRGQRCQVSHLPIRDNACEQCYTANGRKGGANA